MDRRKFIKIAGSSAILLAAVSASGYGWVKTRRPGKALEPWDSPQDMRNLLADLVRH